MGTFKALRYRTSLTLKKSHWLRSWCHLIEEFFTQVHFSCPPAPPSPVLLCHGHKYLCRYVTHIRWQYFRLFPVLHSQLSHCQLSGSHGATAPCLHAYSQSILNHRHCNTHTHTFLTKGKLCICQGHRSNKGEVHSSALCCDELCRLHVSTPSSHTHTDTLPAPPPLICCFVACWGKKKRYCHCLTEPN